MVHVWVCRRCGIVAVATQGERGCTGEITVRQTVNLGGIPRGARRNGGEMAKLKAPGPTIHLPNLPDKGCEYHRLSCFTCPYSD